MNFKDIRESFRNKEISAKELTQDSLDKAKKFSNLNAFINTFDEDALKKAEHIDNNFIIQKHFEYRASFGSLFYTIIFSNSYDKSNSRYLLYTIFGELILSPLFIMSPLQAVGRFLGFFLFIYGFLSHLFLNFKSKCLGNGKSVFIKSLSLSFKLIKPEHFKEDLKNHSLPFFC